MAKQPNTAPREIISPFPKTPPDINKINISPPNLDGYSLVTGDTGTVPGESQVLIVNLSTRNVITTTASANGAFSAPLFAPGGSTILVKYDIHKEYLDMFWRGARLGAINTDAVIVNPLPGATIHHPIHDPQGSIFESAGAFGFVESPPWAGWWLTGTLTGPGGIADYDLLAGDAITITGELFLHSPVLNCSTPLTFTPSANLRFQYLFDANGKSLPWGEDFVSHLFTPTGLPIEHESGGERHELGALNIGDYTCLSQFTARAGFEIQAVLPGSLQDGIYWPIVRLEDNGIPKANGVPSAVIWHFLDPMATLPLLKVGTPATPKIPWTLLADELSNGQRGLNAREDEGNYAMLTRVLIPSHTSVLPRLNERTSEPISYRLEPGSIWLSSTDRRMPNPPVVQLQLPGGELEVIVHKPDGGTDTLGPAPIGQSSVRTPTTPGGAEISEGTGRVGDIFHLFAGDPFSYTFDQYGPYIIELNGFTLDIYGNSYEISGTYDLMVARILDLDPAQLPTTPYQQGDHFAPGLHVFPPVPADIEINLAQLPYSNPDQVVTTTILGKANWAGYFHPSPDISIPFDSPGEFRVDIRAVYEDPEGTLWAGFMTWGNVVEGTNAQIEAHGRRGMDFEGNTIDDTPIWFVAKDLPSDKIGLEIYYPYFSGDVHWGDQLPAAGVGDSIHPIINFKDLTGPNETYYKILRKHFSRAFVRYRKPPVDYSLASLEKRIDIHEAPLFITTQSGVDPAVFPEDIDLWGYTYATSERPDVRVHEIIGEDSVGTAYWRFNDTYGYQIGEPANGDQIGDLKWEFGGVVFRVISETNPINEYAIYSSLWVLLPESDPVGPRITPPFQDAVGASVNGGPIMTLLGEEIDMLFLPKGVRPGDVLELGDMVSFSGHVGPPLDSRVDVAITSPSGAVKSASWHANKIGWLYDPSFDFVAEESGRWTVDISVEHDRPYLPTGITPTTHNNGTVLGTQGQFEFYVVDPDVPHLYIAAPEEGFITWPNGEIEPISIQGIAPLGTTVVYYTIHDKGVVMGQGSLTPQGNGAFTLIYDAEALHQDFSMLSLTAREGPWEGLADEVSIRFLAVGSGPPQAAAVTLIGEEVFVQSGEEPERVNSIFLPMTVK
jgi:hypothetical protein